jgi:TusE/DsrC/DsvC family sulfur relay protein
MIFEVNGKAVETNEQGFLLQLGDWSEEFASELAKREGIELFVDHWELIWYFRDYYDENEMNPTMHTMVRSLGKTKGEHFHDQKIYEDHIYNLFPSDPVHEICKLAGLPMPPPDT